MIKSNWVYLGYVGALMACALLLLAGGNPEQFDWGPGSGQTLILWLAMAALAALSPIPLPWGNARIRWTTAIDVGAILVFGPAIASWFAVISRLAASSALRQPLPDAILRLSQSVCAIGFAGAVYAWMGGEVGNNLFIDSSRLAPVIICGLAYVVAISVISALGSTIRKQQSGGSVIPFHMRAEAGLDVLMLPFGALLAVAQVRIGSVAVALFLIPLLLARYVFLLWLQAQRDHLAMVRNLMSAVDAVDPFTRGHSLRLSKMCAAMAHKMNLTEREVATIEYASLLHDVGRTAIRREVLLKPGRLSDQEYSSVQAHPKFAYDILKDESFFKGAAEIVYCHHEQPNGMGYPRGLTGDRIPIGSRIIMVVAAFDAMTADRPYRRGLSPEAAFEELLSNTGTQFFPEVVQLLIEIYSTGELFEGLESNDLDQLASPEWNTSKALAAYLQRIGKGALVPEKRGIDGSDAPADIELEPTIEMPPAPALKEFPLTADGRWTLVAAGMSDLGCVRKNNEDAFGAFPIQVTPGGGLLVVADGMGGAAAGEVASSMAVELVGKVFLGSLGTRNIRDALVAAIRSANEAIFFRARSDRRFAGMGTTCTAAAFVGRQLFHAHAGDSRAYLLAGGKMTLLTQDHTVTAEMERAVAGSRRIAPEMKNILTRSLGNEMELEVDTNPHPIDLEHGDTLVMCSDGLSGPVDAEEMAKIVAGAAPLVACRRLVELARERGGKDNITVQIARVQGS